MNNRDIQVPEQVMFENNLFHKLGTYYILSTDKAAGNLKVKRPILYLNTNYQAITHAWFDIKHEHITIPVDGMLKLIDKQKATVAEEKHNEKNPDKVFITKFKIRKCEFTLTGNDYIHSKSCFGVHDFNRKLRLNMSEFGSISELDHKAGFIDGTKIIKISVKDFMSYKDYFFNDVSIIEYGPEPTRVIPVTPETMQQEDTLNLAHKLFEYLQARNQISLRNFYNELFFRANNQGITEPPQIKPHKIDLTACKTSNTSSSNTPLNSTGKITSALKRKHEHEPEAHTTVETDDEELKLWLETIVASGQVSNVERDTEEEPLSKISKTI